MSKISVKEQAALAFAVSIFSSSDGDDDDTLVSTEGLCRLACGRAKALIEAMRAQWGHDCGWLETCPRCGERLPKNP